MAQLTYNTMRFGTDNFKVVEDSTTALLIYKEPVERQTFTHLDKFIIDAKEPAGTEIRIAFYNPKTGNIFTLRTFRGQLSMLWMSYDSVGSTYNIDNVTADVILENGHTVNELLSYNNIKLEAYHDEIKSNMVPIIALKKTGANRPKIKMAVQFSNVENRNDHEGTRAHTFDVPTKIVDINDESELTGNASATVTAAYKTTADGEYSNFEALRGLIGKTVYGVKLHYNLHVGTIDGDDKAKAKVTALLTEDTECPVFGEYADLYSITKNFYLPLKYCVVVVKHAELNGARIEAYANLAPPPYTWNNRQIGTGTGSSQTITLPTTKYIDVKSLKVYVNGTAIADYVCNVEDNTITLTAANGATITAYYNYNYKPEDWIKLTADDTQHDISDGKYVTRYWSKITKSNICCSAIKLRLYRTEPGETKSITIPVTPTGEEQTYRIPVSDIELIEFAVKDNSSNHLVYSYAGRALNDYINPEIEMRFKSSTSTLVFTVPAGNYTLSAEYRKKGFVPKIYSWTAGWCV